jgi:hypothetical protein
VPPRAVTRGEGGACRAHACCHGQGSNTSKPAPIHSWCRSAFRNNATCHSKLKMKGELPSQAQSPFRTCRTARGADELPCVCVCVTAGFAAVLAVSLTARSTATCRPKGGYCYTMVYHGAAPHFKAEPPNRTHKTRQNMRAGEHRCGAAGEQSRDLLGGW